MVLFKEHRLHFTERLVQPVELKFWDDMNISILFSNITVFYFKDINCLCNKTISHSLGPMTPVL